MPNADLIFCDYNDFPDEGICDGYVCVYLDRNF